MQLLYSNTKCMQLIDFLFMPLCIAHKFYDTTCCKNILPMIMFFVFKLLKVKVETQTAPCTPARLRRKYFLETP